MQEELETKTVNLVLKASKVTGQLLAKELDRWLEKRKDKIRGIIQNIDKSANSGKQSVKQLLGNGQSVSSIPIEDDGDMKGFQKIANKYGLDFAIVKDKAEDPPKYTVFFKAKDADVITQVVKEYTAKYLSEEKKDKPSILEKLKKFKEIVAKTPKKEKEKKKEQER